VLKKRTNTVKVLLAHIDKHPPPITPAAPLPPPLIQPSPATHIPTTLPPPPERDQSTLTTNPTPNIPTPNYPTHATKPINTTTTTSSATGRVSRLRQIVTDYTICDAPPVLSIKYAADTSVSTSDTSALTNSPLSVAQGPATPMTNTLSYADNPDTSENTTVPTEQVSDSDHTQDNKDDLPRRNNEHDRTMHGGTGKPLFYPYMVSADVLLLQYVIDSA